MTVSPEARQRAEIAIRQSAFSARVRAEIVTLMGMATSKNTSWAKVAEAAHRLGDLIEECDAELACVAEGMEVAS